MNIKGATNEMLQKLDAVEAKGVDINTVFLGYTLIICSQVIASALVTIGKALQCEDHY